MMKIFAHRGYRSRYPENTLSAFRGALETGCYGIELDVQLSKDGELIIMHDETLNRTTNGTGFLKDFTLSELKKLDAGRGEQIPTLREYFELTDSTDIITNIELKSGIAGYEDFAEKVISATRTAGFADRVILSSFNFTLVRRIKALAPDIPAALIAGSFIDPENLISIMREHKIDYIHPFSRLYWSSLQEPHSKAVVTGFPANVWTVNDEWEARKLANSGVNGVFTDDPGLLVKLEELKHM